MEGSLVDHTRQVAVLQKKHDDLARSVVQSHGVIATHAGLIVKVSLLTCLALSVSSVFLSSNLLSYMLSVTKDARDRRGCARGLVLSCLVLSCLVLSFLVLSFFVLSYLVLSCLVL